MKGKKADTNFIADFVSSSAKQGIITPIDIVKRAQSEIEAIDNQLKKINDLKKKRSKLIDVVMSFKYGTKDNAEEKELLQFHQITNLSLAASLCKSLPILDKVEFFTEVLGKDALFIVKQLCSLKILKIENLTKLVPAKRYNDFTSFLKERNFK